jgi:nitrite reductase/ring-hydroxylating ferredoxin subunit/DMSO/TMAO reductase YedYZ heme-binding membrane subunit
VSVAYRAVGWNRQKRRYDAVVLGGVALLLTLLVGVGARLQPEATVETLLIRGLAVTAFVLLHVVLSIGPLCRLDRRLLPLLYNRRHLGVTMGLVALAHGTFAVVQFHAGGDVTPLVSVLSSGGWRSAADVPFELFGAGALAILAMMAATSHDFWLHTLTAPVWKALHMCVYAAYALVVAHVAFGALQDERHPALTIGLGLGVCWVVGLHLIAAGREHRRDRAADVHAAATGTGDASAWVDVCAVMDIPDTRAVMACLAGERVAVFRNGDRLSAVSNVCQHQNGPLGEGRNRQRLHRVPVARLRIRSETGASPPPFTEKLPTFRLRIERGRVLVDPRPNPPGTYVEPARIVAATEIA